MAVLVVTADTSYHASNYDEPLRDLCRDVELFKYGPDMSASLWGPDGRVRRRKANLELLAVARRLKVEGRLGVVFVSAYDDLLEVDTLRSLRRLGACVVNHMVDMPVQWYRLLRTAGHYDCIAVAHRLHEAALRRRARDVIYLPMAASPKVYRPRSGEDLPRVAFVGSWTPFREMVIRELAVPQLRVYGNWRPSPQKLRWNPERKLHDVLHYLLPRFREEGGALALKVWQRARRPSARTSDASTLSEGPLSFERMLEIFSGATVNVGVTQSEGSIGDGYSERWVRGRDFEVPMTGGFYLVQRAPEHEEHYALGEEIETWDTLGELREKIAYYLDHPERARDIGGRGRARALADHTWELRFKTLFGHLGCSGELKAAQRDPAS